MTIFMKTLAGAAGLAAFAAAPAAAQYGYPAYGYPSYGSPYGNAYGYNGYGSNITQMAASQCAAAVQARLNNRVGLQSILGTVLGTNTASARVLTVSSVTPNSTRVRVRGLASSGRMAYNPYGYGYYGALGSNYAQPADVSFKCDVYYSGRVRDIDINRRR
jgi:hypothetical protein